MTGPRIGSLFSGYGGLEQGVQAVLGGTVAWHSEIDPGACKILAHRYPDVPNLGDITKVNWLTVPEVDVMCGGFPCQDVSAAGKRLGLRPDTRSGLWSQFAYAIDQLRPQLVFVENVRGLLSADAHSDVEPCPWCVGDVGGVLLRALGAVLGDLASIGYDASWHGLRAADVGAPHGRFRVFIVAWPADTTGDPRGFRDGDGGSAADTADHDSDRGAAARAAGRRPWGAAADAGRLRGIAGRLAAPGEEAGGRPLPVPGERRRVDTPTHTDCGPLWEQPVTFTWRGDPPVTGHAGTDAAAHAQGDGRHQGRTEPAGIRRGSDAALCGDAPADSDSDGLEGVGRLHAVGRDADGRGGADVAWGDYEPAIRRWEGVLGRPAPAPTELSAKGSPRLSPAFVEWMQGLPAGWVTDVPGLTRNEQLKALGNGVVPAQAAQALRLLLPDAMEAVA